MKIPCIKYLQLLIISLFICINALSSDITFTVNVKTTENEAIPRIYVKIYIPGVNHATDSMFTDNQSFLEKQLNFGNEVSIPGIQSKSDIILRELSPNIISQKVTESTIEFDYPGVPELFFIDLFGKTYSNHSELSSGIYFYYLRFDDDYQSVLNRMVVTEKSTLNVKLISGTREGKIIIFNSSFSRNMHKTMMPL